MKTQSSLDVPKQVRSASFDEIKLEAQRTAQYLHQSSTDSQTGLLTVPNVIPQQRSRSFDSAGIEPTDANASFLDVPRRFARRKSSSRSPVCIHCVYLEEQRKRGSTAGFYFDAQEFKSLTYYESTSSSSSESEETTEEKSESNPSIDDQDDDDDDEEDSDVDKYFNLKNVLPIPLPPSPCITFTLSPTNCDYPAFPLPEIVPGSPPALPLTPNLFFPTSPKIELSTNDADEIEVIPGTRARRRSISRQEAIFMEPSGASLDISNSTDLETKDGNESNENGFVTAKTVSITSPTLPSSSLSSKDTKQTTATSTTLKPDEPFVRDIFLAVPDLKRDRAASVDSCFSKLSSAARTEEVQPPEGELNLLGIPNSGAVRSRSVDIVLPTEEQARYKALALAGPASNLFNKG